MQIEQIKGDDALARIIQEDLAYMMGGADPEGCAPIGSPFATSVGFTADTFDGYLWVSGTDCWISLVISAQPGRGHFSALLKRIQEKGFRIKVPNPSLHMREILIAKGFQQEVTDPGTWCQA